ncbi:MAG: MmgE/PrpD family protein [Candidatus Korobacteraceae bacterium]
MTRRLLLQQAGCVVAATVISPVVGRATEQAAAPVAGKPAAGSAAMDKLSAYMSEAHGRALPEEVAGKAKHHILDTFAAMFSGAELPPGQVAVKFARSQAGGTVATVVASDVVCGPLEAAMANAMLAHSDETDDSHAPAHCHPGSGIVPAALAAGEQFGISGTHFLRAVTLGWDIGTRTTMTLGGVPWERQTHRSTHSIANTFGASAAAGCAAGLNARQMRWLLDYAAQQASGTLAWQRDSDHIQKSLVFAGFPARNGVSGALIIQLGGTGVDDIFTGADNFLLAQGSQGGPEGLIDKLGERHEVTRTDIKKWTVGSPIQAVLDAVEILQKRRPFAASQVRTVVVRLGTSAAKTVNNREIPDINVQHIVAIMLIDKTVSFRAAHDLARVNDPAVLRERAKIQLVGDEEMERNLPRREALVEITLNDGTKLSERVTAVRGTARNPMTREEVVAKARDLITPVLGLATCTALIDRVLAIENLKDIRELRPLLQRK